MDRIGTATDSWLDSCELAEKEGKYARAHPQAASPSMCKYGCHWYLPDLPSALAGVAETRRCSASCGRVA